MIRQEQEQTRNRLTESGEKMVKCVYLMDRPFGYVTQCNRSATVMLTIAPGRTDPARRLTRKYCTQHAKIERQRLRLNIVAEETL